MQQSKLIEIFNCLNKKEQRDLGKFVRSPYYNQREDVIKLHRYLVEHGTSNEEHLKKATVFRVIYPQETYSEKQMRYVMSFLFKTIRAFLAVKEMENDPVHFQTLITRSFRKKNIERLFNAEWETTKDLVEELPFRNHDYHFTNYLLKTELLLATKNQSRLTVPSFHELSDDLTNFFIASSLKQSCLALSNQTINQITFRQNMLPQIINYIEENDFSKVPAVLVYYYGFKVLSGENQMHNFQLLNHHIHQHGNYFPKNELKDIYLLVINYCIRKANEGHENFKKEIFELYKKGLEQEVFIENNHLSRFTYKNIVAAGLGSNEYQWVKDFIGSHQIFLEKKYRQSAYCFNLALYHFKKEEYGKAMELLQQVGTDDVLNNLNARRMLLRIYYDLDEMDALESLLASFQTYIYRKKDLGYHRDLYLNLIRFTRRLLQLDFRDNIKTTALQKDIESAERVAEKAWLLEKLK